MSLYVDNWHNVCNWPEAALPECLPLRRCRGVSRHLENRPRPPPLTHLYGPAVRCKLNLQNSGWSCASVSGPCVEQIAPGHHGYPRAFSLILRSALEGQLGHQITNATARPFSHSSNPTRRPRRVSPISNVL